MSLATSITDHTCNDIAPCPLTVRGSPIAVNNQPADAMIIGAGASGAAVAWSLSQAGIDVVCLEQGDWVRPSDYWHDRDDYELGRQTMFAKSPNVRRLSEDYPVNEEETPISPLMFNAVGGSAILWSGHFPRFRPSDFRVRTLDGVADDWPLTYWDLEPFYDRNDCNIGVAGLSGDPANPPRTKRPLPPLGIDRAAHTFIRGLDKLGWHWWPSDVALITEPYNDDLRQPCNYCGPCDIGCPIGAMSSAHVTYWPKALAQGARLIPHARVREVTVDARGRATGAVYYDRDGAIRHQAARMVIVACNGIGTPRLLLNSVSEQFPNGLANSSGLVGKNLMFHPVAMITGLFDEEVQGHEGPVTLLLQSQEFYESDPDRGFVRGFQLQMNRGTTPLTVANGGILPDPIPWGTDHHAVMREHFGHLLTLTVMVEDLPEPENQVVIDPLLVDSHGIPAPKVIYRPSANSLAALDYGIARSRELYEAAGAHTTLVNPLVRQAGHLMGTARMGANPDTSVVDRWGRSHDCPNLFIVDGSVFVTCSPVNPTSTIQALALRTADWIAANHHDVTT